MSIDRVLVAGAGLMGHGIAESLALAGRQVTLYEPDLTRATAGRDRIGAGLGRRVGRGAMTPDERSATLDRIAVSDDLAVAADVDLVIEAVFEDVEVKTRLWADVDRRARPDTIFASNTSSISIERLAAAVSAERRPRFIGMHFFSPVPRMPIVEMIRGSATSDATEGAVRELSAAMGKQVIVSADRPGFIVNRMLMPFLGEAMRAYQEGLGTAEDIDTGARVGLNHPMGPLELADFIGLDVCLGVMEVLHEGFGQEQFAPPAVLRSLVEAGNLGRKTGRGFHAYPPADGAPAS
jgi:3-hydroxybutyryl-CoA dehydrogenase